MYFILMSFLLRCKGDSPCSSRLLCRLNKSDQTDDQKNAKTLSDQFPQFTNSLRGTSEITDPSHRVLGREGETGKTHPFGWLKILKTQL